MLGNGGPSSPRIEVHSPWSDNSENDSDQDGSEEDDDASPVASAPRIPPRRATTAVDGSAGAAQNGWSGYAHQQARSESMMSSASDTSNEGIQIFPPTPKPAPTPLSRPSIAVPPPPPRRPNILRNNSLNDSPSSASSSLQTPPPLPVRRTTAAPHEESQLPPPPPLPVRPNTIAPENQIGSSSPIVERKAFGVGRMPPPPTRTIGLGEKLPPARRPPSPSSEEDSGDETDLKTASVDLLPDSSRSSRLPPVLNPPFKYDPSRVHIPAHHGYAVVSGHHVVVTTHHHVKIYDLAVSESPVWTLDTKGLHMKDSKIVTAQFRPAGKTEDRGVFVWIGTKEGHVFEVNTRDGTLTGSKPAVHGGCISNIFRHGRSMITLDTSGKALIWSPEGEEDVSLSGPQPRVFRVADKHDFSGLLGGLLWTSSRGDVTHGPTAKIPIVKVYDIFTPGSVGRNIVPTEQVGAVTCGCVLPSQPSNVYLGHEGGFISIWSIVTADGVPSCMEVIKVSVSDVLSLEGVNERLWAGGRKGTITAYDVAPRPWVVTNAWTAHSDLPVLKIVTDPYSIEKVGRLNVVSLGRDEQVQLWDGLLGADWIGEYNLRNQFV